MHQAAEEGGGTALFDHLLGGNGPGFNGGVIAAEHRAREEEG
jgi:hypothetical protein